MTEQEYNKVKLGDILNYTFYYFGEQKTERVRVKGKYSFAGGGRIQADVINPDAEYKDCDAPYSCFELIPFPLTNAAWGKPKKIKDIKH